MNPQQHEAMAALFAKDPNVLLTEDEAAAYLSVTVTTLRSWRYRKSDLPFIEMSGRCVRYRKRDIDKFVEDRMRRNSSERQLTGDREVKHEFWKKSSRNKKTRNS